MRSVVKKKVRMALVGRVEATEQVAPARLLIIKGNPLEAVRRRIAMTSTTKEMKRKPASKNSRKPLTAHALTGVRLCTPLTSNSNSGRVK